MTLLTIPKHTKILSVLFLMHLGTSPVIASPHNSIDKNSITALDFSIASDNLDQFKTNVSTQELAPKVIKNLTEWHFPVKTTDSHYTHSLEATLDSITHESTPVGFSFSSGNADPRSPEYQKADVLPITCTLKKAGSTEILLEHKLTFSVKSLFSDNSHAQVVDKLVDQITTTCFNLLDELKIPSVQQAQQEVTTYKPAWLPSVQVVVKPVTKFAAKTVTPEATEKTVTESTPTPADSTKTGAPNPKKANTNTQTKTTPVKAPETTVEETETDKELIINNQGSPLILHMGHERR